MIKEAQLADHQRETALIKVRTFLSHGGFTIRGLTSISPALSADQEKGADYEVCIDGSTRFLLRVEATENQLAKSKDAKALKKFAFLLVTPDKDPRQIHGLLQELIESERLRRAH